MASQGALQAIKAGRRKLSRKESVRLHSASRGLAIHILDSVDRENAGCGMSLKTRDFFTTCFRAAALVEI
jgi:hypothetical protein